MNFRNSQNAVILLVILETKRFFSQQRLLILLKSSGLVSKYLCIWYDTFMCLITGLRKTSRIRVNLTESVRHKAHRRQCAVSVRQQMAMFNRQHNPCVCVSHRPSLRPVEPCELLRDLTCNNVAMFCWITHHFKTAHNSPLLHSECYSSNSPSSSPRLFHEW